MKVLQVVDWSGHFEINRTRELKQMTWVPVPTKQDSDGYCTLVNHPCGAAHLGGWLAILQIAAKCDPRGTLLRGNRRPHTPQSLAVISRLPAALFEELIPRLLHETEWLEEVEIEGVVDIPHKGATIPQEPAASRVRATEQNRTEQDRTEQDRTDRTGEARTRNPATPTGITPSPAIAEQLEHGWRDRLWAEFSKLYPKRGKLNPHLDAQLLISEVDSEPEAELVIAALRAWVACEDWRNGFVEKASTWISGRMWEVEPPPPKPKPGVRSAMEGVL